MRYVCVRLICVPVFAAGTAATAVFMEKGAVSVLLICVFLAMIVCMFVQICRRYFLIVRNSERRFELMEKTNKSIRELGNDTDIETFLDKCLDLFQRSNGEGVLGQDTPDSGGAGLHAEPDKPAFPVQYA